MEVKEEGSKDDAKKYWSEEIAQSIQTYLQVGQYPTELPASESGRRRNFRKRAKDFVIQEDLLHYKNKKDGSLRLAIASKEEQQRIFEVHVQ